jgi:hypothetical protein
VKTDAGGQATIPNIVPDQYRIDAELEGRVLAAGAVRSLTLTAKTKPSPVIFLMFKGASLSGVVEDNERRPVAGAMVELLEEGWAVGMRGLFYAQPSIATDADGKFVFPAVLPGTYYLRTRPNPALIQQQLRESDSAEQPEARHVAFVNTLYPGTPFFENATPLTVREGADQRDVRIQIQKQKYFSIAGKVSNIPPSVRGATLVLSQIISVDSTLPIIANDPYDGSKRAQVNPDGTFSFSEGLPPGEYWAGFAPAGEARGGVVFHLSTQNLTDMKIDLSKGLTFSGKIVYEDGKPATGLMASMDTFWLRRVIYNRVIRSDAKGEFSTAGLMEGTFRVEFPDSSLMIRKIESAGRSYEGGEFVFGPGATSATITVSRAGATLTGNVELDTRASEYPRGLVTLEHEPIHPADKVKRARLDGKTSFKFEHLEAGAYRVCAWLEEGTEVTAVLGNPNIQERLSARCRSVALKADESRQVELKQIVASQLR